MNNILRACLLSLVGLLFCSSCVATKADLEALGERVERRDMVVRDARKQLDAGEISAAEFQNAITEANLELSADINAKIDEVQSRGSTWISQLPATGNGIIDLGLYLAGLAGTAYAGRRMEAKSREKEQAVVQTAAAVVNAERDRRRLSRQEPV